MTTLIVLYVVGAIIFAWIAGYYDWVGTYIEEDGDAAVASFVVVWPMLILVAAVLVVASLLHGIYRHGASRR